MPSPINLINQTRRFALESSTEMEAHESGRRWKASPTSTLFIVAVLLLLLPMSSAYSLEKEDEENPMQRLSREELVRLAGYGEERLSSVLVTGSLSCEACLEHGSHLATAPVHGATVAVACRREVGRRRSYCAKGMTDEYGDFIIDIPSHLHAIPRLEDACILRIVRLPRNTLCRHVSGMRARRIKLSSVGNGIRTYSTEAARTVLGVKASRGCTRYTASRGSQTTW
ncbi:hypothetical protein HPP92_024932 [Vanilla planifolia]|uniref:Pollen Ole e 1 allergen and extensin family protein n=1 Tax=Vanilla planifolia TaxID=51239 RepID=A0A835PNG0_VANPL|nr:hypothetical protein HPP92_024932 [Vanilla planifolia]